MVLPYKRMQAYEPYKDPACDAFKVERVDHADYYGFVLDGNGRCLTSDFVVTHNSKLNEQTASPETAKIFRESQAARRRAIQGYITELLHWMYGRENALKHIVQRVVGGGDKPKGRGRGAEREKDEASMRDDDGEEKKGKEEEEEEGEDSDVVSLEEVDKHAMWVVRIPNSPDYGQVMELGTSGILTYEAFVRALCTETGFAQIDFNKQPQIELENLKGIKPPENKEEDEGPPAKKAKTKK